MCAFLAERAPRSTPPTPQIIKTGGRYELLYAPAELPDVIPAPSPEDVNAARKKAQDEADAAEVAARPEKVGRIKGRLGQLAVKTGLPEKLRKKSEVNEVISERVGEFITVHPKKRSPADLPDHATADDYFRARRALRKPAKDREKQRRTQNTLDGQLDMSGTVAFRYSMLGLTGKHAASRGDRIKHRVNGPSTEEETPLMEVHYWKLTRAQRNWDYAIKEFAQERDGVIRKGSSIAADKKVVFEDNIAYIRPSRIVHVKAATGTDPGETLEDEEFNRKIASGEIAQEDYKTTLANGKLSEEEYRRKIASGEIPIDNDYEQRSFGTKSMDVGELKPSYSEKTYLRLLSSIMDEPADGWYSDPELVRSKIEEITSDKRKERLRLTYERYLRFDKAVESLGPRPRADYFEPRKAMARINSIKDPRERAAAAESYQRFLDMYYRGLTLYHDRFTEAAGSNTVIVGDTPRERLGSIKDSVAYGVPAAPLARSQKKWADRLELWDEEGEESREERRARRRQWIENFREGKLDIPKIRDLKMPISGRVAPRRPYTAPGDRTTAAEPPQVELNIPKIHALDLRRGIFPPSTPTDRPEWINGPTRLRRGVADRSVIVAKRAQGHVLKLRQKHIKRKAGKTAKAIDNIDDPLGQGFQDAAFIQQKADKYTEKANRVWEKKHQLKDEEEDRARRIQDRKEERLRRKAAARREKRRRKAAIEP